MPVDLSTLKLLKPDPAVTVVFSGLYLLCVGKLCEAQRVEEKDHSLTVTIKKRTRGAYETVRLNDFDPTTSLTISVPNAPTRVVKHATGNGFNRLGWPSPDAANFGWVLDFERELCADNEVTVKDAGKLDQIITIRQGTIYTARKFGRMLYIKPKDNSSSAEQFGDIAEVTAVDIALANSASVELVDGRGRKLTLSSEPGVRYFVTFDNDCEGNGSSGNHDGRVDLEPIYACLKPPGDVKEVELTTQSTHALAPNPCPHPCLQQFLGKTDSLQELHDRREG